MKFLTKLQSSPERTRKIILWTVVILIGLVLLILFIRNFQQRLEKFEMEEFKEELNLPHLEEELKNLPKLNEK